MGVINLSVIHNRLHRGTAHLPCPGPSRRRKPPGSGRVSERGKTQPGRALKDGDERRDRRRKDHRGGSEG